MRWWLLTMALVVIAAGSFGAVQERVVSRSVVSELARSEAIVDLELVITGDAKVKPAQGFRPAYLTRTAGVEVIDGRGSVWRVRSPVLLIASGDQLQSWRTWPVGTRVRCSARLQPADQGGGFAALARIRGPTQVIGEPNRGLALVEQVRTGLRRAVEHRRAEQRALVPALVLGDTQAIPPQLEEDFQATALTHLMAVSGANLTLLLAFLLLAARWIGVRGWWLRLLAVLGVLVFVALCRTEPSVLRAAAMGVVALAALGLSGPAGALRNLSLAALLLLIMDPWLSRSYGFALSVLASAGIVWWARRWSELLRRWLPGWLAEAFAVPLAAHLATVPVVAMLSGRVSLVGLLTNMLAAPFVGPATVFGFLAAGLSLISAPAAAVAGWGAAWSAQVIIWIAHLGARLPGATISWPTTPAALLVLAAGSLLLGVGMSWLLRTRWLALVLVIGLVVVVALRPAMQPGWPPRDWSFVGCDVGQGDGVVVRVDRHQAVVFDSGPDPAPIKRCLDQLGVTGVPLLIFTHFHADHVDGLDGVLAGRRVGEIWLSPYASPAGEADRIALVARQRAIPTRTPAVGERVSVGPVQLEVLGPVIRPPLLGPVAGEDSSARENDESLVTRVRVNGLSMLETGDIEPAQQAAVLGSGADLHADVLKIPHHGSGNQDAAFIRASGAQVAIASAGVNNDYGHPSPRTVRLVESLGMTLLRTDRQGSVAISASDGRLRAVAQR